MWWFVRASDSHELLEFSRMPSLDGIGVLQIPNSGGWFMEFSCVYPGPARRSPHGKGSANELTRVIPSVVEEYTVPTTLPNLDRSGEITYSLNLELSHLRTFAT